MALPQHNNSKIESNLHVYKDFKWQLALEYSGIGMWEYDAVLDRVFFSDGSRQIIGVNNPFFGEDPQDWNERVHPEDRVRYFQDFQDHLSGLKPMYENQHRVLCENGEYKWILDRGKIVEWTEWDQPKRIIGTHTDITNQKQNEGIIHDALNIATEHNNKLKNFAHIVTHNLKQHTANFESLLEFHKEATCPHEKEELIAHLNTLSTSLTKTIANLQDVVKMQHSKATVVKKIMIADEIDTILQPLELVISKSNTTIHNNIPKKIFLYYNDAYFESIIQNLLSNAIKYKHPDRDPVISIDCEYDKQVFKLMVSDNGRGIDLNKFGKDIFGLYKTFHNHEESEGVGLYLIKNQIESFGGHIVVDSEVNVGTTFTIIAKNKRV